MALPSRFSNIFDVMDHIQARPRMWELQTVEKLQSFCSAYYTALGVHKIREADVPELSMFHFGEWIRRHFGWPRKCGWAYAIRSHCSSEDEAISRFFDFIGRYRRLRPVLLGEVQIRPERRTIAPFTNHWPRKVQLFRYMPEKFYFLRGTYADFEDDNFHSSRAAAIRYAGKVYMAKVEEWQFIKTNIATWRRCSG